jgi:ferredoxin
MIFKMFPVAELQDLFEMLAANRIIAPVSKGLNQAGEEMFDFAPVTDFNKLRINYSQTIHSAKKHCLPYREETSSFTFSGDDWQKEVDFGAHHPLVLFGLHPCDINGLNKLDKVLMESIYPNPFYGAKRQNMFIIGHSCTPQPACFCQSMGTDTVLSGCDLFLTPLGDDYFAEIHSPRAYNLLEQLTIREPGDKDHARFRESIKRRNQSFTSHVETSDLAKILDMEFASPVWQKWGEKCLSCGTCAQVCPTCYCYGIDETVDMDLSRAAKNKQLYSCNLIDFSEVAGGHNFRPESHTRLKYRFYHKHRGFVEAFEEPLCTGCGRCGTNCLAGITVPDVIASVRGESHES